MIGGFVVRERTPSWFMVYIYISVLQVLGGLRGLWGLELVVVMLLCGGFSVLAVWLNVSRLTVRLDASWLMEHLLGLALLRSG